MEPREFMKAAFKAEKTYYLAKARLGSTVAERALHSHLAKAQAAGGISLETAKQIYWGIIKEDKFRYSGHVLS